MTSGLSETSPNEKIHLEPDPLGSRITNGFHLFESITCNTQSDYDSCNYKANIVKIQVPFLSFIVMWITLFWFIPISPCLIDKVLYI